jgi:hypothetical protein
MKDFKRRMDRPIRVFYAILQPSFAKKRLKKIKQNTISFLIILIVTLFGCENQAPESETFTISGTIVSTDNREVVEFDHFYIYGYQKRTSSKRDRFEFVEIVSIGPGGAFSFEYDTSLSDKKARKTDKHYLLISGEPLIENPELLAWNVNYEGITLELTFN